MEYETDEYLDVLQNIEVGLKEEYGKNDNLTDMKTIFALENAKIAIKQEFGFAKNEKVSIDDDTRGIIDWCVSVGKERINKINNLSLKDYVKLIDKIKRSVDRHSDYGRRGYYKFINDLIWN